MANEILANATIQYDDGDSTYTMQVADLSVTLATLKFNKLIQSIGTTQEAILLGEVTSPGILFIRNLDATNYVEVKCATSGTIFAKLFPTGGTGLTFALLQLGSGAQAPFAIANTAACRCEIGIASI